MKDDVKIKFLASEKLFGIKKLVPLGGSYAIIIPKMWVMLNCIEIEDNYYLKLKVLGDDLIFSPISPDDIKDVRIKEKK